jgi:uncharacterized membrane protein
MNTQLEPSPARSDAPVTASRHLTSAVLTSGVVVAAACFLVALGSELAGNDRLVGQMTDVPALIGGVVALAPWAWAALGTLAIVLTPVAGLITTAYEYAAATDRRTMWLAVAVLVVLGISVLAGLLR